MEFAKSLLFHDTGGPVVSLTVLVRHFDRIEPPGTVGAILTFPGTHTIKRVWVCVFILWTGSTTSFPRWSCPWYTMARLLLILTTGPALYLDFHMDSIWITLTMFLKKLTSEGSESTRMTIIWLSSPRMPQNLFLQPWPTFTKFWLAILWWHWDPDPVLVAFIPVILSHILFNSCVWLGHYKLIYGDICGLLSAPPLFLFFKNSFSIFPLSLDFKCFCNPPQFYV